MKATQPNHPTTADGGPETLPLLPMQQAKWRAHVTARRVGTNVEQLVVTFPGPADRERVQEAWERVIARTPALRIRVLWDREESEPRQVVEPRALASWRSLDWSALAPDRQAQERKIFLREDRQAGFDLRIAPLLRFTWLRLRNGEDCLVWTFHHILLDGRSMSMVVEDVFTAYQALREGRTILLPERPGFEHFVRWHQAWWHAHRAQAESFWRSYLKGIQEPTALALEAVGGAHAPDSGMAEAAFRLSPEDTDRLNQAAGVWGVTPNTFVQAAWGLLLRYYCGRDAVVFGASRAGRGGTIPDAARALGLFMTGLPVRFDFDGAISVAEVLRTLRARNLALREFEHTPLDQVARWSELPVGSPLFESVVVFDRDSVVGRMTERCRDAGWTFELLQQPNQPLLLSVTGGPRMTGHVVFDGARSPAPLMARMAGQFAHLLRELPRSPERRLADVPVLPPEERAELLAFGRGPVSAGPAGRLLHSWFEEQARLRPTSIAVQTEQMAMTYGELEARANRLAHHLRRLGAAPDQLIAVLLPRSAELVTALLGVLKSGAAYLPIEHAMPPDRVALMLRSARPLAVITGLGVEVPREAGVQARVDLDADRAVIAGYPDFRPDTATRPENLAYAIFTSGTTGTPKLVGVEHRNIANLLAFATTELFVPADLACVPFTSSVAGDACVQQIFAALALGGKLVPFPELMALGGSPFFPQFTWLGATPALLQLFCDTFGLPPAVRLVGVGAEATPPSLLARLRAQPSVREVYNFYGPTEATIYCTVARLFQATPASAGALDTTVRNVGRLIGRPLANVRCHVLDGQDRLVPLGVPGELVVAGAGIARGYLNDSDLTRARFIDEPGAPAGTGRAYRTGDLVRWHVDGQLEFLGRRDTQVKINGVRVELEEIESHLLAFPEVTQAAVLCPARPDRGHRLVAFVVLPAARFVPAEIRRFLRDRLPQALIPATLLRLDAMPLTAAGKIDRQSLPRHEAATAADLSQRRAPENDLERRLVAIWSEVLRLPTVGAEDDFFTLGGDSLQATVLLMSLEADLGTKLTAADLAENPTPRELAARIVSVRTACDAPVPMRSGANEGRFVCFRRDGAKPPILAFTGGAKEDELVELYRPIFQGLPDHPVHCFSPPDLSHRDTPAHNVRFLLRAALQALRLTGLDLDDGLIIWGHCGGAALGLELARRLTGEGRAPIPVAMLDPLLPVGPWKAAVRTVAFTHLGVQLRYHRNMLREGDWAARSAYTKEVLSRAGRRLTGRLLAPVPGGPSLAPMATVNRHFQDLVSYPRAMRSLRTRPHEGPLLLTVNQADTRPSLERAWRRMARGGFQLDHIGGDHLSVLTRHADEIRASLWRWLVELDRAGKGRVAVPPPG